jgi:HSP20 family protein
MNKPQEQDIFEMIVQAAGGSGSAAAVPSQTSADWRVEHQEGQLAVDVLETKDELIIISTMAGADTAHIEVYVHNDLLTIRGRRERPTVATSITNSFHEECYWGAFSRTIVLPVDVKGDLSYAEYTNGILTVSIPKQEKNTRIPVTVIEE